MNNWSAKSFKLQGLQEELIRIRPQTAELSEKILNYMEQLTNIRQGWIREKTPTQMDIFKAYPRFLDLTWTLVCTFRSIYPQRGHIRADLL